MYQYLKQPRDLTQYTLMRGVTDFGNLKQFNLFESGYSYLVVVSVPKFLDILANGTGGTGESAKSFSPVFQKMWNAYLHVLEYEFRGIDGLENVTGETSELTNGISTLNVISKVNMQSASTFSMRYFEKAGSLITRVHETYLRGIKDPRTQIKHYNGVLEWTDMEPGFENETFSFLYFVTDNTAREIEKAYYIVGAQPTTAETNIYNSEKGDIGFKEITVEFNGFPITGDAVDERAQKVLEWMKSANNPNRMYINSYNFNYNGIENIGKRAGVTEPVPNDPNITGARF